MLGVSPGVFSSAWFEPGIGYTLRPSSEITAWNDTFVSNRIGFRAGTPDKAPDVFRIVFVGDSWAYGMGVKEQEAFPRVVERLANQHAAMSRRVECWNLSLPGYNALTETRALEYFLPILKPDAVVLCPTGNDNHSYPRVLPNGSPWFGWVGTDEFGDPHTIAYRTARPIDSYRYRARWRVALRELRRSEDLLARHKVPLLYFFVAKWDPNMVHGLVAEGGLRAPYLITPPKYAHGRWALPPPIRHATAEAHDLYGFIVYQGLAEILGWQSLPLRGDDSDLTLYRSPPAGTDWSAVLAAALRRGTERHMPEAFHPSPSAVPQCAGPIDGTTGWMGRAATFLIRRASASTRLVIEIEGLVSAPTLYPLSVRVSIPSPSGGTETEVTLPSPDQPQLSIEVQLPADVPAGAAMDVVLEASSAVGTDRGFLPRSIRVLSAEQL